MSAGEPYLHDVIIADRACLIEATVAAANLINPRSRYQTLRMRGWWSQTESNRRHPACKAGALPTELWPLTQGVSCVSPGELGRYVSAVQGGRVVGPTRFELVTSRLSSVRSNQLSYGPIGRIDQDPANKGQNPFLGSRSPHPPKRLMRSGKRNEDGGDPLTVYNRNFNRIVVRQEPGEVSLERR
jgi:hypothetical protein